MKKRKWIFNDDPYKTHNFDIENWKPEMCCGLIELTNNQASKIKEFLKCEVPVDQSKPGLTHLIEHVININNHSPIKQ